MQWEDTLDTKGRGSNSGKAALVMTPETTCMQYFLKTCLDCQLPVLFVGPTGTGKSAVTLDHLLSLPAEECTSNIVNFSARTSAALTLDLVMDKLTKSVRLLGNIFLYLSILLFLKASQKGLWTGAWQKMYCFCG